MSSYNRIHNDYDNVIRVELNSYRPRISKERSKEPARIASSINRHKTFTKHDKPSSIIRSETFILKHHEDSSDDRIDHSTYSRSKKKSHGDEKRNDDKIHYDSYARNEMKGKGNENSLYINTDTYRKSSKSRSSLSQESDNLNTNTFTKSDKPKRVDSLIKKFDISFWRRHKDHKEKSPSPSGSESINRSGSKNLFNLKFSGKKSTRDVATECKLDEDRDYSGGIGFRKSSIQPLISERKHKSVRSSQRFENVNEPTGIIKSPERRFPYYQNEKKTIHSNPIRVEIGSNRFSSQLHLNRKPVGIASPLPQARNRSMTRTEANRSYENKRLGNFQQPPAQLKVPPRESFSRDSNDRISFREYRERLKSKNDIQRVADNSDNELRQSYQQTFFVPM